MADVLVRNVPETMLESLKRRAEQHRRSLQQELLAILDAASRVADQPSPAEVAARLRERLARSGRQFSDSSQLVRSDRDR